MSIARIKGFWKNTQGAASLEYIVLIGPLFALVMISFQIALAYHFALTAQKAVELGARIAAVRDPVHTGLPATNILSPSTTAELGTPCARQGVCEEPDTQSWTCNGDNLGDECDAEIYGQIFDEVARIAYLLDPSDLSVTYTYANLGFAGGPFVPIVEVSIDEKPFFLQFTFNFVSSNPDSDSDGLQLPAVAAAAVAEDLSSTN